MYTNNKYTQWYNHIVKNAKTRIPAQGEYMERHHIIPKSLGGSNDPENLVNLTAREHYICHRLLPNMVDKKYKTKMNYAIWLMVNMANQNQSGKRYHINSRTYEYIKTIIRNENSGAGHSQAKIYEAIDPYGKKYTINYLKGFCKEYGFNYDHVLRLIRNHSAGRDGILRGWTFVDINSPNYNKPVNKPKIRGNRKTYMINSPTTEKFTVVGGLEAFCREHNLELTTLQKICRTGNPAKFGSCIGWRIVEIK